MTRRTGNHGSPATSKKKQQTPDSARLEGLDQPTRPVTLDEMLADEPGAETA
jgi:hypothetical protein